MAADGGFCVLCGLRMGGQILDEISIALHTRDKRDSSVVKGKYDGDFFKGTVLMLLAWLWHIASILCNRS